MNFFYEALDETGKPILGRLDATNETDCRRRLLQMGYTPQAIAAHSSTALDTSDGPALLPVTSRPLPFDSSVPIPAEGSGMRTNLPGPILEDGLAVGRAAAAAPRQTLAPPQMNTAARSSGIILSGSAARVSARATTTPPGQAVSSPHTAPRTDVSDLAGVSTRDLLLFFQQLTSLVKSGITIYTALDNLAARTANKNLTQTAHQMAETARNGGRISDTMERYPRIYPDHIVGLVRAGELGGFLEIALAEIAHNYEQNIALYRGAWIPKLMASQALIALALAIPLVPAFFAGFLAGTGTAFINFYLFWTSICLLVAGGIFLAVKLGANRLQLPKYRYLRDKWSLKLPPFGTLQRQAALAAFIRMLRRLYQAGVAPIHAWEGAMNTASNVVIRDKLAQSYNMMQQGATLPHAFAATGLFANSMEQLIATGHESGEVVESLDQIAEYYQNEVDEAAKKSRFMMLRYGLLAMLILGGIAMIWIARSYSNLPNIVEKWAEDPSQITF